ncbi:two tm domain protein [Entamoeba histolytica]|uniref:Two tm domain protein n=1 Tax=Entamoeba histolytica TaxID=5759 RepID=A0A175JZR9_ENTHI|nr:two tm domain protein [Entamoeba histolytica]
MFFLLYPILQSISAHIVNFFFGSVLFGAGAIAYACLQSLSACIATILGPIIIVIVGLFSALFLL